MSDTDEEIVTTPGTSMFEEAEHVFCCFNMDLMLCGVIEPGGYWDQPEAAEDEITCPPCKALFGTGFCPLGMDCETRIAIRNEQLRISKANEA